MLYVYEHYKYVYFYSVGIDFRRQILTSKVDPHTVRANVGPAMYTVGQN